MTTGENLDTIMGSMLDTVAQLVKLIDDSQHPLIVFGVGKNDDSAAAAVALAQYLGARGKQAEIASHGFDTPTHLAFLDGIKDIKPELSHLHKFTIKVDVSKTKLETLSYDVKDGWLSIHLTPRQGAITKDNLRTLQTGYKYDLIFVLGATDLQILGDMFFNNTDLFYRTPIVNVDTHPGNEHFGALNLVDLTATSVAEIIFQTFEQTGASTGAETATAILTGMIAGTRSFKTPNVTPATLNLAGKLMNLGADRDKIVRHLYRTKSISTLKLWGRALSVLQTDREAGLVWTTITRDDFIRSGTDSTDLNDLVVELIANSPEAKIILVLFEDDSGQNKIRGFLTTDKNFDALDLAKSLSPTGTKRAAEFVFLNQNLKSAEETTVAEIRKRALEIINILN